jgi:serine/threonine-protein kinase
VGAVAASGDDAAPEFELGQTVAGKYLIGERIGEGGLGVVFKAKHVQLDQDVAIKHVKRSEVARAEVVERFLQEARLAAKIKNEHAVKVQDVDVLESGIPYMVMELLEGRDLESIALESPLPMDRAVDYLLQACEALAEAHAAGIVHRDLKPGNLFLAQRPGGTSIVKVLDFGISKSAMGRPQRVTRVGEIIGTPEYMSPEQLRAQRDVDARSDIWALGVTLYELVTGKLPFNGDDLPQLCVSILTKPPVPMSAVHPDATPELEAVVVRCLEKEPAKRYQNVAELAHDLGALWEGESPSRVQQIARVVGEGSGSAPPPVRVPTRASTAPTPAAPPAAPVVPAAAASEPAAVIDGDAPAWADAARAEVDHVTVVLKNASDAVVDELQFVSIDEAYEYACSQGEDVVRCEIYDEFAGVRGKLRVTYVRSAETGHWVPRLT